MLKNLQKFFKQEGVQVEMTTNQTNEQSAQIELAVHEAVVAELSALKASFAEQAAEMVSIKDALEKANAALAVVAEEKAAIEAAALQAKTDARRTKLQEIVGDVKAEELVTAFEGLDDKVFEAMANTLSANMDQESQSAMFNEKGVDAEVKEPAEVDMVTRLAAKIEAQIANKTAAQ
jgi:rRNA-processing protein FCF1